MAATILVVDDDAISQRLVEMFLTKAGYQVEQAFSGSQCLHFLESRQADLIFLDVEMPGMAGTEVLQEIRQRNLAPGTPIYFLSGSENMAMEVKLGRYPVDGFVKRPFLMPEFVKLVRSILG